MKPRRAGNEAGSAAGRSGGFFALKRRGRLAGFVALLWVAGGFYGARLPASVNPPDSVDASPLDSLSDRLRQRIEKNRSQRAGAAEEAWMAKLPPEIIREANLPYANVPGVDPRLTSLDVFRPGGEGRDRPIVVFVHGGGMSAGDKSPAVLVENKARYFPVHGFVFVSLNYRLAPEVRDPVATRDIAAGIAYVRAQALKWGANADALFLIGHSAGAQLVIQLVTDAPLLAELKIPARSIRGAVMIDTALYDIPFAMAHPDDDGLLQEIVEMTYGKSPARWAAASPINRLDEVAVLPPLLLFHAAAPESLSSRATLRFAKKVRSLGGTVSVEPAREKDHSHLGRDLGNERDWITETVMQFFLRAGAPARP
jgi:acetyl esterase/lipase